MECKWYKPSCWLQWLSNELKEIALWFWNAILSGLASLVEMVPAPDFLLNLQPIAMHSGVAYFVDAMNLQYGIAICVSAYIIRFLIRRIPLIG